ncbi:unnamed protein product [Orchesella dallaii]|uniref:Uncharacterized protein n=1 Tax=Orchesella dallaii TaxID=48710 RepID=A0ABP1S6X9_9HEXA
MACCLTSKESALVREIRKKLQKVRREFRVVIIDFGESWVDLRDIANGIISGVNSPSDLVKVLADFRINFINFKKEHRKLRCVINEMAIYASEFQYQLGIFVAICDALKALVQNLITYLTGLLGVISEKKRGNNIIVARTIHSTLHELNLFATRFS